MLKVSPRKIKVVVLLAAASCSVSANAFDLLQYFPTPAGASWEYRYTDSSTERACAGIRVVRVGAESFAQATLVTSAPEADKCSGTRPQQPAEVLESTDTLNTEYSAYRLQSRSASAGGKGRTQRWVLPLLFMPTFSNVYQTYSSSGIVTEESGEEARSASYRATVKVVGLEDVNVPAGRFKSTVHLQLIERRDYSGPGKVSVLQRTDRWLVRGLGVVRVRVEVLVNDQRTENSTLQLLRASVPSMPAELQDQLAR